MNSQNHEALGKILTADIEKIQKSDLLSDAEQFELFKQIVAKYVGVINNLYDGLYGYWVPNGHQTINYAVLQNSPENVKENLQFLCGKLELAEAGFGLVRTIPTQASSSNKINIQNNFTPSISFEDARSEIKNIAGLTNEQVKDALSRIEEIEKATNNSKTEKMRWEKIKPILVWLGNSSFELAKVILPLIIKS